MRLERHCLAVTLVLLLMIGLTGCGSQKAAMDKKNAIPLMMMASSAKADQAGDREEAFLGYWDVIKGEFTWDRNPVFVKEKNSENFPRLVWDGGDKIFACSFGDETSQGLIKVDQDKICIKDVKIGCNRLFAPMEGLSDADALLAAYPRSQSVLPKNAVVSWPYNDIIIHKLQGKKLAKTPLPVPDYVKGKLVPLLITGTADHFKLLLFYNNNMEAKTGLVLADVTDEKTKWQKIDVTDLGLIAGAGAVLAFNDDKINLSEPVMSVIDLNSHPLKIKEFTAATELRQGISKNIELAQRKHGEVYPSTQLGAYEDMMLMAIDLPDEHWIWAFRGT